MFKQNCSKKIQALVYSDVINKYLFKSFFNIPKLKKSKISIPLKSFTLDDKSVNTNDIKFQMKTFVFFYQFLGNKPFIKCVVKNLMKKQYLVDTDSDEITLKFITTKSIKQYDLLVSFFIENAHKLIKKTNLYSSKVSKSINHAKITLDVPINFVYDLDSLFKHYSPLDLLDFTIPICFYFDKSKLKHDLNYNVFIKHFPFFNYI